jgi:hypothetical protein
MSDLLEIPPTTTTALARLLPHPFSLERIERQVVEGQTIDEIMAAVGCKPGRAYFVLLNGIEVPPQMWTRVRPKAGSEVTIKAVPLGGGGGDSNKTLRTVLLVVIVIVALALTIAAPYLGPVWGIAALGAAAAISIGGALAINALLPPKFNLPRERGREEPGFSITGSRNVAAPGQAIPRVYGRHRMFPLYAARPYTEIVGEHQYLRMLFTCGMGPVEMQNFRIGETPLSDFSGVDIELREGYPSDSPLTLFGNVILEEALSLLLKANVPQIRTTEEATDEISVDVTFPAGLFDVGREREPRNVSWRFAYSPMGASSWTTFWDGGVTADTSRPLRRGASVRVPRGRYDVRATRLTPELGKNNIAEDLYWTALRSIQDVDPIPDIGMSKIALRIKASDQLNGVVDQLSCLVEAQLRTWNGVAWGTTPVETRNPASAYLDVLTGSATKRPIPESRIDMAGLGAWYDACEAAGREYRAVIDYRTTIFEALQEIAVAGRASFAMPDGKYGVVRDVLQTVPVQVFTPRNSWGFSFRKTFPDRIDGFKMPFVDETHDYQASEVTVLNDDADPLTASVFETLTLPGITNPDQLWREGRYHLAVAKLRPELWTLNADPEHLVCQRGDLVEIMHDVLLVGLKSGRLTLVTLNASSQVTAVNLDEPVTMEIGKTYGLKFRRANGSLIHSAVTTVVGEDQGRLTLTPPLAAASAPAVGDLFVFGEWGTETVQALVKGIFPGEDLSARLELVPAAPAVHDADTGPIPDYDPVITVPPELRTPPTPLIEALVSQGTLVSRAGASSIGSRITVQWVFPSSENLDGATMQLAWRVAGLLEEDPWQRIDREPQVEANQADLEPLPPGSVVEIRIRAVTRYRVPGSWVVVTLIELPNPPVFATYVLTPVTGGYLARIDRRIGPPPPPNVTGLRLINSVTGSPNDTNFAGITPKFTWNAITLYSGLGDGEDDQSEDTEIRDYRVEILSSGLLRRIETQATPGYAYEYEANLEDHAGLPARQITIRVRARSADGQVSLTPAELTVQNPAPDMSQILPVLTPLAGALLVDWRAFASTDYDLDRFDLVVDATTPPSTVVLSADIVQREAIVPNLTSGTPYYVQIRPYDAFGEGVPSQIASATPTTTETVDFFARSFTPEDIVFAFDPVTNLLSWTAGTLTYTTDGTTATSRTIVANSTTWSGSGSLIVFYVLGETIFHTTTSVQTAIQQNGNIMAVLGPISGLVVNWGKAILLGADIAAHAIAANHLVVGDAVITNSIQIAAAIITNAHITNLSVSKLTAGTLAAQTILGAGEIATAASGARVRLAQGGLDVFDVTGISVVRAQATIPYMRIGKRIADGATVPPLELDSAGTLTQIIANQLAADTILRYGRDEAGELTRVNTLGEPDAEDVTQTFSSIVAVRRTTDKVAIIWYIDATLERDTTAGVTHTGTIRLRRGGSTSSQLVSDSETILSLPAGTGAASTRKIITKLLLDSPGLTGTPTVPVTYCLTLQAQPGESGVILTLRVTHEILFQASSA